MSFRKLIMASLFVTCRTGSQFIHLHVYGSGTSADDIGPLNHRYCRNRCVRSHEPCTHKTTPHADESLLL
jgi:hypothetical protein